MSVHYGYNYKKDLIKKMRIQYAKEIEKIHVEKARLAQIEEAENLIVSFFSDLKDDFIELAEASNNEVQFLQNQDEYLVKMQIHNAYVQFNRKSNSIDIEIGAWNDTDGFLESRVVAYVIPGDKRCLLKRVGKVHDGSHFDESTINSYIRMAFAHLLDPDAL